MDGTIRSSIKVGTKVQVVQKQDQRTGKLTEGKLLTGGSTRICIYRCNGSCGIV